MAAIATADALNVLYVDDENIMRFRWYSPDKVLPLLQDLRLEHKTFISDKTSRISPTFITEDEIDKLLIGSTKYSTQKIETYLYFKENTDAQERIKFLKDRYGIGGGASGVFWNNHDAKGISFSRSDIFSPFAKVTLPWNKVEKRIDGLIKTGKYLTEREINEDIPRYQSEQDQLASSYEENAVEENSPAPTDENQDNIIGRELTIDDRNFIVESVGKISGDVTLRDITFENSVGFPISRVEKIDTVLRILEEQEHDQESLIPHIEKPKQAPNTVIYPEIPMSERRNFRITDDNLGHGTPTQKYERNIEAIKTLKKLEDEHRLATPEEQEILSQYVGWGGLADCFDERNSHYAELKSLLTPDEYSAARESTLTAFYTPPVVIRSIYKALENMGLKQGNILDPAMGVGNFEGMLPDSMSDCKMYGIELDSISGRIAQQLYQKNAVTVQGYEDTTLPDSFFDGAIGNVPFANVKVLDRKYNKHKFLIHDYFFAKTLEKVRPGGVVAFITSSGTMDKKNSNVHKYIAQRADLIGAIRLPDKTFKANAGTEVTSDILFLQKRDRMTDIMPEADRQLECIGQKQ